MAKVKRQFIDGPYGQMHLRIAEPECASRLPLFCLHMFPQSGRNFGRFLEEASQDRIVVAPDFPGYGESAPPPSPISAHGYAEAMWEVAEEICGGESNYKIDLFGIHAGAKLGVEMASQHPRKVNKIVLSSAAVIYPEELEKLKKLFSPVPLDEKGTRFRYLWDMLVKNCSKAVSLEMMATFFAEMLRGGEGYEWGHMAVFEYNSQFPSVLSSLSHPIALLNPGDELYRMTPRSVNYIQNCELFDCPEWGHGFLEVHATEVAELVNGWLVGA